MNKRNKKILLIALALVLLLFVFQTRASENDIKKLQKNMNCFRKLNVHKGQKETNARTALFWNNPSGLIKTRNIWYIFNELPGGHEKYKYFASIEDGYKATIYNALYQLKYYGYNTAKRFLRRWLTGNADTETNKTIQYINNVQVLEDCEIKNLETLRALLTNLLHAENVKNDTETFYNNFYSYYNDVIKKFPSLALDN
jgi:hypothetical protein